MGHLRNTAKEQSTVLFAEAIKKKWERSGLSRAKFFASYGDAGFHVNFCYMINGKRGLTLARAIKIANALGINLGKIQRLAKEEVGEK